MHTRACKCGGFYPSPPRSPSPAGALASPVHDLDPKRGPSGAQTGGGACHTPQGTWHLEKGGRWLPRTKGHALQCAPLRLGLGQVLLQAAPKVTSGVPASPGSQFPACGGRRQRHVGEPSTLGQGASPGPSLCPAGLAEPGRTGSGAGPQLTVAGAVCLRVSPRPLRAGLWAAVPVRARGGL